MIGLIGLKKVVFRRGKIRGFAARPQRRFACRSHRSTQHRFARRPVATPAVVLAQADHGHRQVCWRELVLQLSLHEVRWLWIPARASLGRDDSGASLASLPDGQSQKQVSSPRTRGPITTRLARLRGTCRVPISNITRYGSRVCARRRNSAVERRPGTTADLSRWQRPI